MNRHEPIVIYRSVNRDGATFALRPGEAERLRALLGDAVHVRSRVFIAHETSADMEQVDIAIAPQVVQLLTGVTIERLSAIGSVAFREPVNDREVQLSAASA